MTYILLAIMSFIGALLSYSGMTDPNTMFSPFLWYCVLAVNVFFTGRFAALAYKEYRSKSSSSSEDGEDNE